MLRRDSVRSSPLLLVVAALAPLTTWAAWPSAAGSELPICLDSSTTGQRHPALVPDGRGGVYIAWYDGRPSSGGTVYAQHVDSTGNTSWTVNGVQVASSPTVQTVSPGDQPPRLFPSGDGFLVLWKSPAATAAALLDADAGRVWPAFDFTPGSSHFVGVSDDQGGAYVAYIKLPTYTELYLTHLGADGYPQFPTDPLPIDLSPANATGPRLAKSADHLLLSWLRGGGAPYPYRAQRVTRGGSVSWDAGGLTYGQTNNPGIAGVFDSAVATDGDGGVWVSALDNSGVPATLFVQHFEADGTKTFAPALVVDSQAQYSFRDEVEAVDDGHGGLFVAWVQGATFYLQQVRGDGGTVFAGRRNLTGAPSSYIPYHLLRVARDGDHLYVGRITSTDVIVQRLAPGATTYDWGVGGVTVASVTPSSFDMAPDGVGGLFVTFMRGNHIYANHVRSNGTLGDAEPPPAPPDAGTVLDAGVDAGVVVDAGLVIVDAGLPDAGAPDAGAFDAGAPDAGAFDAGAFDAGTADAGAMDAGADDAGEPDAGAFDAGVADAGAPDSGFADAGEFDAGPSASDSGVETGDGGTPPTGPRSPYSWQAWGCGCGETSGLPLLWPLGLLFLHRRRGAAVVLGLALLLALPARAAGPAKHVRLFFPGLTAGNGVSAQLASGTSDFVQTQLLAQNAWQVLSAADVSATLAVERQRAILGCGEEKSECLAEMASALDAQRVLRGSLSQLGTSTILTLSLIDTQSGRAIAQRTERVKGERALDELLDVVPAMVTALKEEDPLVSGGSGAASGSVAAGGAGQAGAAVGLVLGVRGEVDVAHLAAAPAVAAVWMPGELGAAAAIIVAPTPGVRAEARWQHGVLPYVGLGVTVFAPAIAPRLVLGGNASFGRVVLSFDLAGEYFVNAPDGVANVALLASLGVGVRL